MKGVYARTVLYWVTCVVRLVGSEWSISAWLCVWHSRDKNLPSYPSARVRH